MSNRRSYSASQYTGGSKKRGMSPGRSMAQFGHAGHAGKSQSQAQKHQKAGINTPSRGPGSNPNMGQTPPKKTATVSTPKKTTLKNKIKSGIRTLADWKHIRDVLTGNVPGIIKNIGAAYGANKLNKLLGDQAYRGGDIQSWDEDDVSGLAGIDFSDMIGTTPDTDYTQLAKVYGAPELTEWGATPGMFKDTAKFNDMQKYQEIANQQMNITDKGEYIGKEPSAIRKSIDLGKSLYGINMENVPKDFLETKEDFKNQKILGDIKFNEGGLVNFFKNGGFLG